MVGFICVVSVWGSDMRENKVDLDDIGFDFCLSLCCVSKERDKSGIVCFVLCGILVSYKKSLWLCKKSVKYGVKAWGLY